MPKPRFQFRLRTLMIVVTLLAVACWAAVWMIRDHWRMNDEMERIRTDRDQAMSDLQQYKALVDDLRATIDRLKQQTRDGTKPDRLHERSAASAR